MKVFQTKVEMKRSYKQYESDTVSLESMFEEGDDVVSCISLLKKACSGEEVEGLKAGTLGDTGVSSSNTTPPPKQEPKKKEPKAEEPKKKEPKAEEPKKKEPKAEEPKKKEPKAEEPKKKEPKAEEPKKVKAKSKHILYNRMDDVHKKHLGQLLDKIKPEWRKKNMTEAIAASKALEKTDFMDSKGNILESFENSLTELMA